MEKVCNKFHILWCANYRGCGYMLFCTCKYIHSTASNKLGSTPTLRVSNTCIFSLESTVYFTNLTLILTVSASFSSQMSLCAWFLFCVTTAVVWQVHQVIFIFGGLHVTSSSPLFYVFAAVQSPFFQNVPCVTGWLEHNVWTQHTGLIFKGYMSSEEGPLQLRPLHCLQMSCTIHPLTQSYETSASFFTNGKTWQYSSMFLIHNFCDSFQGSLKLIYLLILHFIFLFVQ
jgi:hypothetical protein